MDAEGVTEGGEPVIVGYLGIYVDDDVLMEIE